MPLPLYHSASTEPPSYAAFPSAELYDDKRARSSKDPLRDGAALRWQIPLLTCRALSMAPASWWGLKCVYTLLRELLLGEALSPQTPALDAEKRFQITELFLAALWVCPNGCRIRTWLKLFWRETDCDSVLLRPIYHIFLQIACCQDGKSTCYAVWFLLTFWYRLLYYTPPATVVRLLATNATIAWLTSYVLYLSGASDDSRMLLPAWVCITTVRRDLRQCIGRRKLKGIQTLTLLYHLTQRKINIKRETSASINVFSIASFISMSSLLLQLHQIRANDPIDPLLSLPRKILAFLFPNLVHI